MYVVLDEKQQPLKDNKPMLRKFYTFFNLGPKNYFGGRVLIAESSVTTEGKELSANGDYIILPS